MEFEKILETDTLNQGRIKINAQVSRLSESIVDINDSLTPLVKENSNIFVNDGKRYNLLNQYNVNQGYYIDDKTGEAITYKGWACTDYIEIQGGATYSLIGRKSNGNFSRYTTYSAFYDKDKRFISGIVGTIDSTASPVNAKYMRVSWSFSASLVYALGYADFINSYVGGKNKIKSRKMLSDDIDLSLSHTTKLAYTSNSGFTPSAINNINRIGNIGGCPENSILGFLTAYNKGFNAILVDCIWTSDGVPVCCHDNDISRVARTSSGDILSGVKISDTTYNTLLSYDFGIVKGEKYKGAKLVKLETFIKLAKYLNVKLYVEFKDFSSANYSIADTVKIAKKNGFSNVSWCGGIKSLRLVKQEDAKSRLGLMVEDGAIKGSDIDLAIELKDESNDVFLFGWTGNTFTDTQIDTMITNEINYEFGTINKASEIVDYINSHAFFTGIESDTLVASQIYIHEFMSGSDNYADLI